jgi:transposase
VDRGQSTLFPECLDDWIGEESPVRVIDVFVDELDLAALGFSGVDPEATGRPSYHPAVLLKLYIYGYLNRVQSSRRLEREAGRNVEVMWLTGRLVPDHKTIADFRKDNGRAVRQVCARFVALCRTMGLFAEASVAIDGSKFKAGNNRDRNFTRAKMQHWGARGFLRKGTSAPGWAQTWFLRRAPSAILYAIVPTYPIDTILPPPDAPSRGRHIAAPGFTSAGLLPMSVRTAIAKFTTVSAVQSSTNAWMTVLEYLGLCGATGGHAEAVAPPKAAVA